MITVVEGTTMVVSGNLRDAAFASGFAPPIASPTLKLRCAGTRLPFQNHNIYRKIDTANELGGNRAFLRYT